MTAEILKFAPIRDQNDFGGCPTCHGNDGCLTNLEGEHYFVCRSHELKWKFGRRKFPAWLQMGRASLTRQEAELDLYHEVQAWFPAFKLLHRSGAVLVFEGVTGPLKRGRNVVEELCSHTTNPNHPVFARVGTVDKGRKAKA